jgi:hypothetical protein
LFICSKKIWRTKSGEEAWRRHVEKKRLEQFNTEKQRSVAESKQANRRRTSSRESVTSGLNSSRQQQVLTANPQMRSNRSLSRVSFLSTSMVSQLDNNRLLKPIHQGSMESLAESVRSGIHVEFKLSTQNDETKQQTQISNEQKGYFYLCYEKENFNRLFRSFI